MRVSNSKLKTYRRCQRQYRFKYVEKLETRQKSIQLERGTWVHALLEEHYNGNDWKAKHKELSKVFYELFEEQREDLGDLPDECRRIMLSYLRHWRMEDEHFIVVDSEMDEIITLPNGLELQIIVDLIVEDNRTGLLWAWDHKTRKNFERSEMMLIDPQLTTYFDGLKLLGYEPLGGVMYNEIRTKPPTIPNLLKSGELSQAKNIDTDVYTYRKAIKQHDLDEGSYGEILRHIAINEHEKFFKRTKLPKDPPMLKLVRKETMQTANQIIRSEAKDEFPRNFMPQSCKWDCDFKDLCMAELHGADYSSLVKMNFRKRGPRGGRK